MNPDPSRRPQRRRPDLSVNTSRARSLSKDAFPPLPPPARKASVQQPSRASSRGLKTTPALGTAVMASSTDPASSRAARAPLASSHAAADADAFLDMYAPAARPSGKDVGHPHAPVSEALAVSGQRDSHDLSLPSRHVRDSLVSNMLLSLDQFSMGSLAGGAPSGAPARTGGPSFEDNNGLYSLSASTTTDENIARAPNVPTAPRGGGGTGGGSLRYGYNYSSDYEAADDESRVSGSISHGRRSNSSSGFQSSLGRINSLRESSMHRGSQPGTPGTPRMMHSRGGKGSKSSSTNSLDTGGYVQVLGSQRWAHGFGGRSSSFDLGPRLPGTSGGGQSSSSSNHPPPTAMSTQYLQQVQQQQQQQQQQPSWHIEFSNSFFNDAYDDAAPTPTVPGGPRKLTSVPSMPSIPSYQSPPSEPPPAPERRRSVRSSRSATVGRQPQPKLLGSSAAPPLPAFDLDSAPAPNIGYEKSKEVVPSPAAAQQQQPHHPLREKPSFFRRVFGSFRDSVSGNEPVPLVPSSAAASSGPVSSASVETNGTRSLQHSSGGQKPQSTPPSRDSHHSTHATLQKKPSGFFRRRKKSFSETESPPPLPTSLALPQAQQPALPPQPSSSQATPPRPVSPLKIPVPRNDRFVDKPSDSPATSLRRAMSPYLKGSTSASANGGVEQHWDEVLPQSGGASPLRIQQKSDSNETPRTPARGTGSGNSDRPNRTARGFSPDYEPPPTATIRSVDPEQAGDGYLSKNGQRHHLETPSREPPVPPQNPARSGSFLSDDSDTEGNHRRSVKALAKQHRSEQDREGRSSHPPLSLPTASKQHLSPSAGRQSASKKKSGSRGGADDGRESQSRTGSKSGLPIDGAVATPSPKNSGVHLPITKLEKAEATSGSAKDAPPSSCLDEPEFVIGMPTEDDRQKALNIYEGNEEFIQKGKAAAWMGEEGPVRQRTLRAYMDLYDFRNQSIANALREVCSRLVLRAETQQVDRILVAFSKQWCACNPNHGFKSMDVVHTTCYSIMLLNTDLHLADIETKMTRSQFIKNTMTSILHTLAESAEALETPANGILGSRRPSVDQDQTLSPPPSALPPRSESSLGHNDDCGPLVKAPVEGPMRLWESQMEVVLKMTYNSIRDERLPLFGADGASNGSNQVPNQNQSSLSVMGMLKRTPSVLSKAPSEGQNSTRGRVTESTPRAGSSRWTSKSRSRARGPVSSGGGNGFASSRTSFEDGNSIWSPSVSSATWSRQSLGRTQASMSMDSFGSQFGRGDYQQSIGFANALSQAIIREDALGSGQSIISDDQSAHYTTGGGGGGGGSSSNPLLDDESLELAGPPWVKEGMMVHKHHLDGMDKKAKDRNWVEVFAVVQQGQMSLFSFTPSKSLRAKNRGRHSAPLPKGTVVGGGNWRENATTVGSFGLKQTLASALPPPGYSRQRPHVWALSLPTGAVHLFQVGTPEICKEFVTTANYWSARLSTHPLVGGISNIEYGWGEAIVNNALVSAIQNESSTALPSAASAAATSAPVHGPYPPSASRPGSSAAAGRASMQSRSSFRSGSFDFGHARSGSGHARTGSSSSGFTASAAAAVVGHGSGGRHGKLPGDRIHIAEWMPPTQSLRASSAAEPQQLKTLLAYVQGIEGELQAHNALRSPMLLAFTPRGHNANKAMANWERKSSYLLREIVKYRTYVDCLTEAARRRSEIYHEREIARRAARGEGSLHNTDDEDGDDDQNDDDDDDHNDDDNMLGGAGTAREDNNGDDGVRIAGDGRRRRPTQTDDSAIDSSNDADETLRP